MGFNIFLYGFIIVCCLWAKSFDYEPPTNESKDSKCNTLNNDNDIIE